jgi:hypothetical protein
VDCRVQEGDYCSASVRYCSRFGLYMSIFILLFLLVYCVDSRGVCGDFIDFAFCAICCLQ